MEKVSGWEKDTMNSSNDIVYIEFAADFFVVNIVLEISW